MYSENHTISKGKVRHNWVQEAYNAKQGMIMFPETMTSPPTRNNIKTHTVVTHMVVINIWLLAYNFW